MSEPNLPRNERGSILMTVIFFTLFLSLIWVLAMGRTLTEIKFTGQDRGKAENFYQAETGLKLAQDQPGLWLTDEFIQAAETNLADAESEVQVEMGGETLGTLLVRPVQDENPETAELHGLPVQSHRDSVPEGEGFGMRHFEAHRFAMTMTAEGSDRQIQAGAWILRNK